MILILSSPSKAKANDELYPIYPAEKFPSDEYDSMVKSNLQFSISVPFSFSLIHHLPTFHHSSTEDSTFLLVSQYLHSQFSIILLLPIHTLYEKRPTRSKDTHTLFKIIHQINLSIFKSKIDEKSNQFSFFNFE
ncbi:hypothetical protein H4I96_01231 [Botrytis cinerea]